MTWHPDLCADCSHQWHGLRCIRCACPTAWIEPPQTAPTTAGQPKPLADLRETANLGTPPRASRERTLDTRRVRRPMDLRLLRDRARRALTGKRLRGEA